MFGTSGADTIALSLKRSSAASRVPGGSGTTSTPTAPAQVQAHTPSATAVDTGLTAVPRPVETAIPRPEAPAPLTISLTSGPAKKPAAKKPGSGGGGTGTGELLGSNRLGRVGPSMSFLGY